jgi:hypothetical protein
VPFLRPPSARRDGDAAQAECGAHSYRKEAPEQEDHANRASLARKRNGLRSEEREHCISSTVHEHLADAAASNASSEDEEIGSTRDPKNGNGEDGGHGRGHSESRHTCRPRRWYPGLDAIPSRDMPGHEDRDLRHDGIGKAERGRELRELLDRIGDETGVLEPRKAIGTRPNVRLEGGNAKALLVIEEEVDLSREKVTVIHREVYALAQEWVSGKEDEEFDEKRTPKPMVRRLTSGAISMELFRRWHSVLALGLEVLESSPELVAGAMDVGLYGAQREIEGRRDLFVRSTFDVTQ